MDGIVRFYGLLKQVLSLLHVLPVCDGSRHLGAGDNPDVSVPRQAGKQLDRRRNRQTRADRGGTQKPRLYLLSINHLNMADSKKILTYPLYPLKRKIILIDYGWLFNGKMMLNTEN